MTQRFTLFSEEKEDFVLELLIDSDATFHDLHQLILQACGYTDQHTHAFMVCDEDWRVRHKIHQSDTGNLRSDEDLYLMAHTRLEEFMEDEGQHLAYIFDSEDKRFFLMELTENIFGRKSSQPTVSRRHGTAPAQQLTTEDSLPNTSEPNTKAEDIEENFYGDDGFNTDELDSEGFEIDE